MSRAHQWINTVLLVVAIALGTANLLTSRDTNAVVRWANDPNAPWRDDPIAEPQTFPRGATLEARFAESRR